MSRQIEYEKLACKILGLVHQSERETHREILLDLGYFQIIESEHALDAVIERYLALLKSLASDITDELQDLHPTVSQPDAKLAKVEIGLKNQYWEKFLVRSVLSFTDYTRFIGKEDAELKRETPYTLTGASLIRDLARFRTSALQGSVSFSPTRSGYRKYLKLMVPNLSAMLSKNIPALVPEDPRREHSYVVATTGTGKSELLKAITLNYVQNPDYCGVVVLDPGGDMVEQIARWPEFIPSGRLVYIDPSLDPERMPVINPFDADNLNDRRSAVLTTQIVKAIGALVEGKIGGAISVNMEAVLYPAVRLLVDLPGANLKDLRSIMRDDEALLEAGRQSPHEAVREYCTTDYKLANLNSTKQSIAIKIQNILSKGVLDKVLCGRTTLPLEKLLRERKIVLFNLSKGLMGEDESSALGTLVVSLLQSIAQDRALVPESKRPVTHFIVDEAQNFVSTAMIPIIEEARKFGLPLTLAQLSVGRGMSTELEKVVVSTSNVKVVGRSDGSETRHSSAMVNVASEDVSGLTTKGAFYYKNGTSPPFLLHTRTDRLKTNGGVNNAIWKRIKEQQLRLYYRAPPLAASVSDGPAAMPNTASTSSSPLATPTAPKTDQKRKFV